MSDITNINAGLAVVKIIGDNSELRKALDGAQNELERFGATCTDLGKRLAGVGLMITAPFVKAIQTYAEFDSQMRRVGAVTGTSGQQLVKLTEQAKQLGATTSFTASQVAQGMSSLGMMGFDHAAIQQAIPQMMALARATGTDLAVASQIAANNLGAFGLQTSEVGKMADYLAFTANHSAQNLEDLGEAMKTAAPTARTAGQSVENTAAALGVLALLVNINRDPKSHPAQAADFNPYRLDTTASNRAAELVLDRHSAILAFRQLAAGQPIDLETR